MGATRAIRALPDRERAATPIIALTGNVRDEDIRACYAANMNGHLAKPIEPDKLKAQIDKVILGRLDNPVILEDEATQSASVTEIRISDKQNTAPASSLSFEDEDEATGTSGMSAIRTYALSSDAAPKTEPAQSSAATTPPAVHPVRATVFTDMELDEDSFATALEMSSDDVPAHAAAAAAAAAPFAATAGAGVETAKAPIDPHVFDHGMLDGLKTAMRREELKEMIDGLTSKNDEILVALQSAIPALDFPTIGARAHEMKGMSGNFGLRELSELADRIEKAARNNVPDGLSDILALLPDANSRSKAALDQWINS
jgi:CheY-like chemotaxis protein